MNNAQTFIREIAQDGNEAPVYFNEVVNSNNWWVRRRRKERIANVALELSLLAAGALYWLKRRARRAIIENLAPFGIVVGTLVAFLILGYIEVGL